MSLKESGEMYLESIYVLKQSKQSVRSIDVAEYMNFTKPSVSRAIGLLKKQGYIVVDKDGYISFTDDGEKIAGKIYERHTVLTNVLKAIGIDEKTAAEDACRIEHDISPETFECLKRHVSQNTSE